MIDQRIRASELHSKIFSASEAADLIESGMTIGTSGFTPAGYPKAVSLALAKKIEANPCNFKLTLHTGASVGDELDGALSRCGAITRRSPYQTNKSLRNCINSGKCEYTDVHLSHSAQHVRYGFLGDIDIAIIEAVAITEDGYIIPSTSIGNTPTIVESAKNVIVEINLSQPLELEGLADIYIPESPPNRKPIPLVKVQDRIGTPYIKCPIDKIKAIVITDIKDDVKPFAPADDISERISKNIINFLKKEVSDGRLPSNLLPLQSGVGNVANAVLSGLLDSDFENLTCYTEVVQDSMLNLIDSGKVSFASSTAITPSKEGLEKFINNINFYKSKIILRPQEISNNPEVIRRLGVIAMNTAVEVDIYGNVNSTHIMGQKMVNGIGGSGDFSRNSFLSIFSTPSTAKNDLISCIVPMVSHHDHTEHDVNIIVTEFGVADLRNKSPKERANIIIENCSHPDYRDKLREYFNDAKDLAQNHTPHILSKSLSWHEKFLVTGSMK